MTAQQSAPVVVQEWDQQVEGVPETGLAAAVSRFTDRYRKPVIAVWLAFLAVAAIGAMSLPTVLSGGGWYVEGTQSKQAADGLAQAGLLGRGHTAVTLVVHDRDHTAGDAEFEGRVRAAVDVVVSNPVLQVSGAYGWSTIGEQARAQFVGEDRRTAVQSVALGLDDGAARRELPIVQKALTERFDAQGLDVSLVSPASFWGEVNVLSAQDLAKAELFTFPLIALILLLLYRSAAAALVSLVVGGTAIVFTLGALSPIAHHYELSTFVQNAATMLGLGVGVDYSLFMISRFKEELRRGRTVRDAVTVALRRSGHTVLFSGITVVAAMSTLFVIDLNVIASIALGSVVVVAISILVSVLVLPALLHVIGTRINRWRLPWPKPSTRARDGRWHGFAMAVMRRPALFGLAGVVVLAAMALPAGGLRTFSPDARIIPVSSPVRQGFDHVQQQFGVGITSPVQVVVRSEAALDEPGNWQRLSDLNDRLGGLAHVVETRSVVAVARTIAPDRPGSVPGALDLLPDDARQSVRHFLSDDSRTAVVELITDVRASEETARELVTAARDLVASAGGEGFQLSVGGETAEGLDANEVIQDGLPLAFVLMLAVVFLLLLVTFRSLAIPLKAVVMNVLSLAATYGVLVLVFQDGVGTEVLGLMQTGHLQNFVPVLLLALLFSLSTDYEVFLLDRVRENYLRTGDNATAVAAGVESTAPLISGAAILMVVVFGTFGLTGMVPIQQLGIGLAVTIILDATIVRLVLVPAAMRLMGRFNWWLPGSRPS